MRWLRAFYSYLFCYDFPFMYNNMCVEWSVNLFNTETELKQNIVRNKMQIYKIFYVQLYYFRLKKYFFFNLIISDVIFWSKCEYLWIFIILKPSFQSPMIMNIFFKDTKLTHKQTNKMLAKVLVLSSILNQSLCQNKKIEWNQSQKLNS